MEKREKFAQSSYLVWTRPGFRETRSGWVSFFSFIWVWDSSLDGGYSIVGNFTREFFFSELNREVIYLGRLHHPNLVKLIGYSLEDEDRVLVYEYMPNGSLENHFVWNK